MPYGVKVLGNPTYGKILSMIQRLTGINITGEDYPITAVSIGIIHFQIGIIHILEHVASIA